MSQERRFVGYRRSPLPFVSLYDCVYVDGEYCNAKTGEVISLPDPVPVYEGDEGWEEVERLTGEAVACSPPRNS